MEIVGIRELKNKLSHYVRLSKDGDRIIITERGKPVAVIHRIEDEESSENKEEVLASLAKRGLIKLPSNKGPHPKTRPIKAAGIPASKIIIDERR